MKWLKIIAAVLVVFVVGGWAYHGWILPPKDAPSSVHAATKDPLPAKPKPTAAPAPVAAPTAPVTPVTPKETAGGDSAPSTPAPLAKNTTRIVATDGALTEIVYALGFGDRVVAADSTAQWPHSVTKKPSIGYVRRLSAEGVLSLNPTVILNNQEAGPPEAIDQLRASGIQLIDVPGEKQNRSFPTLLKRITFVAQALGVPEKGRELAKAVEADLDAVRKAAATRKPLKALFLFNPTVEKITAGGKNTGADEFLTLAGLTNVAANLEGWKPLSQESIVAAAPDILITSSRSHQTFANAEELLKVHGLAETPAGKTKRVVYVDGSKFLSGGPRIGEMGLEFLKLIHPDLELPKAQSSEWFKKVEEKFRD